MDTVVASYVSQLSNGEADPTLAAGFFEDVLAAINRNPVFVNNTTQTLAGGAITIPNNVELIYLISPENAQLGELSVKEADWVLPNWRSATGTPLNYVIESFDAREMQPVPYETGMYTVIATFIPSGNLTLSWLQMPVALLILGMEYSRESDHQNIALSKACTSLGQLMMQIGLKP